MEDNEIYIDKEVIEKVIFELKEINNCCPDYVLKKRISDVTNMLMKASNYNEDKPLQEIIHEKMKEAAHRNPELHSKLYMLYRSLSEGKTSEEDARQLFEAYLQIYPYDTLIY
ncbi:hypothetical protein [Clostridium ganghwense]|uniref:Uncharacterized protein n=1 Tax=Clostridium ganghwense TaxID=312089 RepID=A0ABT4CP73_9CLOT|nr:hypothetical protein [Clostridium ganghwense]MCY6370827.1 hypothetical protein [Clostridium ganghwense]